MQDKLKELEDRLGKMSSVALAFSGGVDSTFLLAVLKRTIGEKGLLAISVASQFVPQKETVAAKDIAARLGVEFLCLEANILENKDIVQNTSQRCYFCKQQIFTWIKKEAESRGINTFLHGVNTNDLKDFRPGLKAAQELGFLSPLADAGLAKSDIRELSRQMGLETWDKPSQSCLATRIPYHDIITAQKLDRIDKAETVLHDLGFDQVRVRCHGKMARIEVEQQLIDQVFDVHIRQKVSHAFKEIGFDYTSIDIDGYKTGKMNHEILTG